MGTTAAQRRLRLSIIRLDDRIEKLTNDIIDEYCAAGYVNLQVGIWLNERKGLQHLRNEYRDSLAHTSSGEPS